MSILQERNCRRGLPLKKMWTAAEAALVKRFLDRFEVKTYDGNDPFIDRSNPYGEWKIYIPGNVVAFPWGDRWPWGFEFFYEGEVRKFKIWNPLVSVASRLLDLARGSVGLSASPTFLESDPVPLEGKWWLYVEVKLRALDENKSNLASDTDVHIIVEPTPLPDEDREENERVMVAVFDGKALVRDFIHGTVYPAIYGREL